MSPLSPTTRGFEPNRGQTPKKRPIQNIGCLSNNRLLVALLKPVFAIQKALNPNRPHLSRKRGRNSLKSGTSASSQSVWYYAVQATHNYELPVLKVYQPCKSMGTNAGREIPTEFERRDASTTIGMRWSLIGLLERASVYKAPYLMLAGEPPTHQLRPFVHRDAFITNEIDWQRLAPPLFYQPN